MYCVCVCVSNVCVSVLEVSKLEWTYFSGDLTSDFLGFNPRVLGVFLLNPQARQVTWLIIHNTEFRKNKMTIY